MPEENRPHRSSSGSRSHHPGRSSSRRRASSRLSRRYRRYIKTERNFIAALFSIASIVTACTALAEPDWFALKGGLCRHGNDNALHTLGVYQFFYGGHFEEKTEAPGSGASTALVYHFGPQSDDLLKDCVDGHSLLVIRLIIACTFLSIICSSCAFTLDLMGSTNYRSLRLLRRNGVFCVASLAFLVTVTGLCYWCTSLLYSVQRGGGDAKTPPSRVIVSYAASFYIVVGAAAASIFAAASNLLQRWPPVELSSSSRDEMARPFANDFDDFGWPPGSPPPLHQHAIMPPEQLPPTFLAHPPPYMP